MCCAKPLSTAQEMPSPAKTQQLSNRDERKILLCFVP